jgi:hypothetical protein
MTPNRTSKPTAHPTASVSVVAEGATAATPFMVEVNEDDGCAVKLVSWRRPDPCGWMGWESKRLRG